MNKPIYKIKYIKLSLVGNKSFENQAIIANITARTKLNRRVVGFLKHEFSCIYMDTLELPGLT